MALPATDDFNRSNSSDLGTNWDVIYGTGCQVVDNTCGSNTGSGDGYDGAEVWNADSFADDQYSTATVVGSPEAGGATGVAVRCDPTPDDYFYGCYSINTASYLYKVVNGAFTTHGTGDAWSDEDVIYIEADGTTITVKKNDINDSSVDSPWTDSDISSGSAGVCGYGTGAYNTIDDWEGGDLGGEPGPEINIAVVPTDSSYQATGVKITG